MSDWIDIKKKRPKRGQRCHFYSTRLGYGIGKFKLCRYSQPWTFVIEKLYNERLRSEFADLFVTHWKPATEWPPLELPGRERVGYRWDGNGWVKKE